MPRLIRVARFVPLTLIALLAIAPSAHAGRLLESGHDFDFHCGSAQNTQCHFVKVALDYVRGGAPVPSKPVLVLDRAALAVQSAIQKAYAPAVVPMTVVDPRSGAFTTTPIDTAHWSAIFVASDINCSGCDLNDPPSSGAAVTLDSTAIAARTADIAAFFDAGGGIIAGAGASDSGGFGGISFGASNVPYYSFVATSGAGPATGPFQLTSLGTALGLVDADLIFSVCGPTCTHNSFGFPPAGSRLKPAEVDPGTGRFITLIEDTDPPAASVQSGPPATTTATSASFTFASSESPSTYQCRLDGAAFTACPSPFSVSGVSEGRHEVDVRAVDLVGNVQPTPTAYSWSVCLDRDGDGFTSCSSPPDCNDNNKNINSKAPEVNGNKVDENCDGFSAPFDRVDASISYLFVNGKTFSTVARLNLSKITSGARLTATCSGGGCPFKSKRVTIKRKSAHLASLFKKKKKNVRLKLRATVRLSVTKAGSISKVFTFKVRGAKGPSFASQCQLPTSKKLQTTCPVFAS